MWYTSDMNEELKQKVLNSFTDEKRYVAPRSIWRIRINGEFVMTRSKKTAWSKRGHAVNAIINHLQMTRHGYTIDRMDVKDYVSALIKNGDIELIELTLGTHEELNA